MVQIELEVNTEHQSPLNEDKNGKVKKLRKITRLQGMKTYKLHQVFKAHQVVSKEIDMTQIELEMNTEVTNTRNIQGRFWESEKMNHWENLRIQSKKGQCKAGGNIVRN